jgi:hypothetical protein
MAQVAYSAGRTLKGDAALQTAWDTLKRVKSVILEHEAEELGLKLLALEGFLRGIEEKSQTTESARSS